MKLTTESAMMSIMNIDIYLAGRDEFGSSIKVHTLPLKLSFLAGSFENSSSGLMICSCVPFRRRFSTPRLTALMYMARAALNVRSGALQALTRRRRAKHANGARLFNILYL